MSKLRILELVAGFATGDQLGGAELFGIQLARQLDRTIFEPAVVGLWRYGSPREQVWQDVLDHEGIYARLLADAPTHLVRDLGRAFARLWAVVSSFQPHIVNSHSERTDLFNMLVHLYHPLHPRAVRTMHTDQQWQDRPWLGMLLSQIAWPSTFDVEIGVSQATQDVLRRRPLSRLLHRQPQLCEEGVDDSIFARDHTSETFPAGIPPSIDGVARIGCVGRLMPQKGHRFLLDAAARICEVRPLQLLLMGAGPLEMELRAQAARLRIEESVYFLGSRDDVLDILPTLDLVVSASLWEGFPYALLEAMALEVPVVATDVSGSRELIRSGATGTLIPPGDDAALADAIMQMLNEPEMMRRMTGAAKQLAMRYTIQQAAIFYGNMYGQLVDRP